MSTWVVLASGPSMAQAIADSVRGRCHVVAVSDCCRLAPWADALASSDAGWWKAHPDAQEFAGRKFTLAPDFAGLPNIERLPGVSTGINSGLMGIRVAVHLGATRVLLLGFDMHSPGAHFFGKHQEPLRSSTQDHMERFKRQFAQYRPKGVEIVNCTPGSRLLAYPMGNLEDCLAESAALVG